MEVCEGIYFFHISFLKEVSDGWLTKKEIGVSAKLFMNIVLSKTNNLQLISCNRTIGDIGNLITCDRTIKEISKTKYILKSVPGFIDLITEKSLPGAESIVDNDIYSLKVASLERITPFETFFVVSDSYKEKILNLAKEKGYTLKIISPEDFKI